MQTYSNVPLKKGPQAKLDFGWNWAGWLYAGDTIVSSEWTITGPDTALMKSAPWSDTRETGVWLTGGILGGKYQVTNHIVTAQGREDDRTLRIEVVQR